MTAQPWSFGDPTGPGDQFNARDHLKHLIAFVQPSRETVTTRFGTDETTRCRYVVCLDGADHAGQVDDNPLVFGNLGQNAWGGGESAIVLGRVDQAAAKAGQSPAFILQPATEEEKATAKAWFDAYASMNAAGHIVINE